MEDVTEMFCIDPDKFMRKHIIIQRIGDPDPGVIGVKVWADPNQKIVNVDGGMVCAMGKARPGSAPSLAAYWCPYQQNERRQVMLGNEALYAFTPTMDGCSIGLGADAGAGSQLMSHVNAGAIGAEWAGPEQNITVGRARQSQSQFAQLQQALGPGADIVSPSDYRVDSSGNQTMSSTTYALHAFEGSWSLHALTYRKLGASTWLHGGVRDF